MLVITPRCRSWQPRRSHSRLSNIQHAIRHSLLSTTADTYGHLASDAFNQAASILDAAYGGTTSA
jgi:hypothetical protein